MLIKEAKWLNETIKNLNIPNGSIFLNFGSQNIEYYKENKTVLDNVILPIKEKYILKNLDLQSGVGIDYSGDIYNEDFFNVIKKEKFDCILVCNLLEHVTDIDLMIKRLSALLDSGGYLIFSGPYGYPVHFDPIDNHFRPTVEELCKKFEDFKMIKGEIIEDFTFSYYLKNDPGQALKYFLRLLMPFYKFNKWKQVVYPKLSWLNKKFTVTCVLLQKN